MQDLRKGLLEMQTQGHKFDPLGWPTKMMQTEPKCAAVTIPVYTH